MEIKKGDLITVRTDGIKRQFKESGDFETVMIESQESEDGFSGLEALSKKHIYKVTKDDLHKDLAKYGVNVGHYTLQAIKVDSLSFPVEGEVRVNGEFDIPFKATKKTRLANTYFFNEVEARTIATVLNMSEREKLAELKEAVENAEIMLDKILSKAHV